MFFSLVQLAANVTLVFAPCPAYLPTREDCYVPESKTAYVAPILHRERSTHDRDLSIAHEFGHADDFERLTTNDRRGFQRLLGFPSSTPWWGRGQGRDDWSPAELYAETYAVCALGGWAVWTERGLLARWRVRRVCRLLPPSPLALARQAGRRPIAIPSSPQVRHAMLTKLAQIKRAGIEVEL